MRLQAQVPAETVVFVGLNDSTRRRGSSTRSPTPTAVVLPPSNPVVSVGTILGVPQVREAITATRAPVVGLSPIVGGAHVRGMAEQMLTSIGVGSAQPGVGLHYGARTDGGVLDGWLVDVADADDVGRVEEAEHRLLGRTPDDDRRRTAAMAAAAVSPWVGSRSREHRA